MSYGRSLELSIGDVKIVNKSSADLRVDFDVTRDKSRDPNSATFRVWNLAKETRAQFEKQERLACELVAGYRDQGTSRIFLGVLLDCETSREGPDLVTTFSLGDDAEARAAVNRINRKFGKGIPVAAVLRELIKAAGLKPGNLSTATRSARLDGAQVLPAPYTASGNALQELHTFTRSVGLQLTLQDGEVRFLGFAPALQGRGPVLTGENVESPSVDAEGTVSFTCRLLPDLIPGVPFRLETEKVTGDFAAIATHTYGDTHGGEWSVDVQGDPFSRIISKGLRVNA